MLAGSGKSTLLHLLGGLDTPSSGSILVDGRDLAGLNPYERTLYRRSTVGLVFQSYYLVPSLTAEENIALALTFQGTFGDQRQARREAIGRVGLAHRAGHRPSGTSGGEQQRVVLARAIVHSPPLLLADEPTATWTARPRKRSSRSSARSIGNWGRRSSSGHARLGDGLARGRPDRPAPRRPPGRRGSTT